MRTWALVYWNANDHAEAPEFHATEHWVLDFLKRHDLSIRRRTSLKKLPTNLAEKMESFYRFFKEKCLELEATDSMVYNMDESAIALDSPPMTTIDVCGSQTVPIETSGHESSHVTVALCCNANGEKIMPFVIKRGVFKVIGVVHGVFLIQQEHGWMCSRALIRCGIVLLLKGSWYWIVLQHTGQMKLNRSTEKMELNLS